MMINAGTVLQGRYKITRLIGHGGMGAVYEALDSRLGDNPVALKQSLFATEQLRRAFEREAILLARLRHPNLPKVFDHFDEGTSQFLVMEFIMGSDLEQLLTERERPFSLDTVLIWAAQILDALKYLHTRVPPVIHRDIKPGNLKLTPEGQLMLIDFGLAKGQGGTSSIVGYSAHYAPIEQLQREGTGPESDIYSLAATIYRLLTGEPPATSLVRVTEKAKQRPDPLRPANELMPTIPAPISQVLLQAMELDKEDRMKSAEEMLGALRAAASAPAANAPPVSPQVPPPQERFTQLVDAYLDEGHVSTPFVDDEPHRVTNHLDALPVDSQIRPRPNVDHSTNIFPSEAPEPSLTQDRVTVVVPVPVPAPEPKPKPPAEPKPSPAPAVLPGPAPESRSESSENRPSSAPSRMADAPADNYQKVAPSQPAKSKSSLIWLSLGLLIPILLVVYWFATRETPNTSDQSPTTSPSNPAGIATVARQEVIRYTLEVEGSAKKFVTEGDLPAGKGFRLHFRTPVSGYLYLIALDEAKRQMAFLNDSSSPPNAVQAGVDYVFPSGESLIEIDAKSPEAKFTVIFSPSRLAQIGFFNQAPHALSPAELGEFETFRRALSAVEVQPDRGEGWGHLTRPSNATGATVFDIVVRNRN